MCSRVREIVDFVSFFFSPEWIRVQWPDIYAVYVSLRESTWVYVSSIIASSFTPCPVVPYQTIVANYDDNSAVDSTQQTPRYLALSVHVIWFDLIWFDIFLALGSIFHEPTFISISNWMSLRLVVLLSLFFFWFPTFKKIFFFFFVVISVMVDFDQLSSLA